MQGVRNPHNIHYSFKPPLLNMHTPSTHSQQHISTPSHSSLAHLARRDRRGRRALPAAAGRPCAFSAADRGSRDCRWVVFPSFPHRFPHRSPSRSAAGVRDRRPEGPDRRTRPPPRARPRPRSWTATKSRAAGETRRRTRCRRALCTSGVTIVVGVNQVWAVKTVTRSLLPSAAHRVVSKTGV